MNFYPHVIQVSTNKYNPHEIKFVIVPIRDVVNVYVMSRQNIYVVIQTYTCGT